MTNNKDSYDVVVDEKADKVLHVHFKNSNKKLTINLVDGTSKADETGLREDCPQVKIETQGGSIYIDTPNMSELL